MVDEYGSATSRKALLQYLWENHGMAWDWAKFGRQWCVLVNGKVCATGWRALHHFTVEDAARYVRWLEETA